MVSPAILGTHELRQRRVADLAVDVTEDLPPAVTGHPQVTRRELESASLQERMLPRETRLIGTATARPAGHERIYRLPTGSRMRSLKPNRQGSCELGIVAPRTTSWASGIMGGAD